MKPRTLIALVVIGILAIGGGWYFGTAQRAGEQQAYSGGRLMFPDLAPKLQDAARIEITHQDKTTAIEKHGDTWGLVDRGGYVVQAEQAARHADRADRTPSGRAAHLRSRAVQPARPGRPQRQDRNVEPAARARRIRQADRRAGRRPPPRAHAGQCAGTGLCASSRRQPDLARRRQPAGRCRSAALARARHHEHRPRAHRRAWR